MKRVLREHFWEAMQMFGLSNKNNIRKIKNAFRNVKKENKQLKSDISQWIEYLHTSQQEILNRLETIEQKLSSTK